MQNGRIISLILVFIFSFIFVFNDASAQTSKINLLKNDKSTPFKEGETIIAEVTFTGLDSDYEKYEGFVGEPVYERDVFNWLRESRALIRADEKFDSKKIEKTIKILKEELANYGYLKAKVVAFGKKLPKNQMKLVFAIEKGSIVQVSEIRFAGNSNISNEEFIGNLKECSGERWKLFERRRYNYYTQMCSRQLLFSKGYFRGGIKRIMPQLVGDNYVVTIEVSEGLRFVIGEIKINGAKAFSEKEILEIFGQKTGDVADGKNLQDFVYEKLKDAYADKGYILYDAEFEPVFIEPQAEGLDATVDISINIDEGRLFKLAGIEFAGVEREKAESLRKLFDLRDEEIYNQNKVEEAIKKINELREFYPINIGGADVEIRTNENADQSAEILILPQGSLVLGRKNADEEIKDSQDLGEVSLLIRLRKIQQ